MKQSADTQPLSSVRTSLKSRFWPWLWTAGGLALGLAVFGAPDLWLRAAVFAVGNLAAIAPVIVIGVLLVAAANATGAVNLIAEAFDGRIGRMIFFASAIGALTPVCGVSVLPLVAGLLGAGVPLAPIMAFWLSSPVTDPGMLAITAGTLGVSFAIAKTAAAFAIGLFGGAVTLLITRAGGLADPLRPGGIAKACGGCSADTGILWRFWTEATRRAVFAASAISTIRLVVPWLAAAFVAEFFLKIWLPAEAVAALVGGDRWWAVPVAATVGTPIYLDGYAALPLVRGLIDSGMAKSAALAFLVAGGVTSAWAIVPVFALVRLPVVIVYVALAWLGAILVGLAAIGPLG